jgi:hypothetical protein
MVFLLIIQTSIWGRADSSTKPQTKESVAQKKSETFGEKEKRTLGEGFVFISSSRSRVNQKLRILSLPQDIALYKQSYAS